MAKSTPPAAADPAWDEQKLADPHAVPDKARRVRQMFAAIARSYDLNNRVHSLWRDQAWRRKTVKLCEVSQTDAVVDVACGTGDLAMAFDAGGAKQVIGIDFTHEMLQVARHKAGHGDESHIPHPTSDIGYADGDAMRLPVADQTADIVSIAFGIRNVADPDLAIREFHRILRPGGRLAILEFSLPRNAMLRGLYNFYFKHILPRTASLIARDRSGAYKYLPKSVNTFIDREQMTGLMTDAGFDSITLKPLTFGIAVAYVGVKN